MNYSNFSLFDQQIFDLFEKKYRWMKIFFFQEIFRRLSQKKFPGDWNEIPGEFQEISRRWPPWDMHIKTLYAILSTTNSGFFRPGPARPDAIHEICRPGPARARGVEARPGPARSYIQILQARARPGPGPARKARGPGPGLNTLVPMPLG